MGRPNDEFEYKLAVFFLLCREKGEYLQGRRRAHGYTASMRFHVKADGILSENPKQISTLKGEDVVYPDGVAEKGYGGVFWGRCFPM